MAERHPTPRAARLCSEWLRKCRELGWPSSATGKLCDLWWEFHDDDGNLIEGSRPPQRGDADVGR